MSPLSRRDASALGVGGIVGVLGGLIGLGGAEFRLPILTGLFRFPLLPAVVINLVVSLVTVLFSLIFRAQSQGLGPVLQQWPVALKILAGAEDPPRLRPPAGRVYSTQSIHSILLKEKFMAMMTGFIPAPRNGAGHRFMAVLRRSGLMLLVAALASMAGGCTSDAGKPGGGTGGKEEGAGGGNAGGGEVMVFAAASLRETLQELGAAFEKETGTKVVFNFAGSNELARQIGASRTADLFLSASESWMDTVEKGGRVAPGTRRDLLSNTLVVIGHAASQWTMSAPCDLAKIPFKHLALADPKAVPAGQYASKWLNGVQCDGRPAWEGVQDRVAPAPDVRAALGQVVADPAMVGIVYKSDWMAFSEKTRVIYEVKDGPPIRYVLAQIAEGKNPDGARRFYDYMTRAESATIYQKHGFGTITSQALVTP